MKIESSNICFQSKHDLTELNQKQEKIQFWTDKNSEPVISDSLGVTMDISEKAQELQKRICSNKTNSLEDDVEDLLSEKDKQKVMLLEAFLENILGKKIKFILPKKIKINKAISINQVIQENQGGDNPRTGWGLIYNSKTTHYESEKVFFKSTGTVITGDGKQISVDLQLNMSRKFMASKEIHISAGNAVRKDPLIINFDSPYAILDENKFSFDIDCDGSPNQISRLLSGSGFLSLDLNNDGFINDGSELFGPKSGNGFKDLSYYDSDNNGWIDENDAVFDKLRVWSEDEYGNNYLFALGEKGIGALCLDSASTPFSLISEGNIENGMIQKTGIFIKENGLAGTLQHIDLTL